MTARDDILRAVRRARPGEHPLPSVAMLHAATPPASGDLVTRFAESARASGASVMDVSRSDLTNVIDTACAGRARVLSVLPTPNRGAPDDDPHTYADVDLFICEGVLGVAESGAIWLPDSRLGVRSAFFLATDVIIVLAKPSIVSTLHDAYARLDVVGDTFGVFVAGPSKTADIEQALVVGAHGPKSLTVLLTGE